MKNVLITGVGGQGSVLAARILAQAAQTKGWQVRTTDTLGMAQRGGFVSSHVRMGDAGETVYSPLLAPGTADLIIAMEPAEALRVLPYLAPNGVMVTAETPVFPVSALLAEEGGPGSYDPPAVLDALAAQVPTLVRVDDEAICASVGSRKVLNIALLATAVGTSLSSGKGLGDAVQVSELIKAIEACVKPRFVTLNCSAVDSALAALSQ